jgi:tetratricopeptide (TPR) repeat protein
MAMKTMHRKTKRQGVCGPTRSRAWLVGWIVGFVLGLGTAEASATQAKQTPVLQDPNTPSVRKHDSYITQNPMSPQVRQLWKSRITAASDTNAGSSQQELQRLIEQLGAMELKPRVPTPAAQAVELTLETKPNEPVLEAGPAALPNEFEGKLSDGTISKQTLEALSRQLQQPELLKDPLQAADILFNSGCLKEAAICYREAIKRLGTEGVDPLENKAWILLQLGNCLQPENPQAALEQYGLVIVECSDSLWAELAKAKSDLIQWQLNNQPRTLLKGS